MDSEGRKQSMKRAESRTSTLSRTPSVKWRDQVLSPSFHDVKIEQVQIVGPPTGVVPVVKAPSERRSSGGRSSAGIPMLAPPPSEEGSMGTNNSEERRVFRDSYLYEASERVPSGLPRASELKQSETMVRWADPDRAPTVPLVNLPLEPPGTVVPRDRSVFTRQQSRQRFTAAEQMHRQKIAILRHMQRLQSNESPQQRRLMSGGHKKRRERYYEVSPGVMLSELPPDEKSPKSAPSNEFGLLDDPIQELYERAKTVPHITKSIIWTDKNRVASGRVVSSNSSKWRSDEFSDMESQRKVNIFIKMPFKQSPCITMNKEKQEEITDDIVRPGYELRLTTAFTVSRVKKGIKRLDPPTEDSSTKAGRLLKGKLKPLYPVKMPGPTINRCQGIQPEGRAAKQSEGYTPSPSRQQALKDQLNKIYDEHRSKRAEYERRMIRAQSANSRESVHRTSPEPAHYSDFNDEDITGILNEKTGLNADLSSMAVSNLLDAGYLDSGVIF